MSYYANGSGTITFNKMDDRIKDELKSIFDVDVMSGKQEGTYDVSVWAQGKYSNMDTEKLLSSIADYTVSGEIRYIGEDDEAFRWRFNESKKRWEDENGEIVYWSTFDPHDIPDEEVERFLSSLDSETKRKIYYEVQKEFDVENILGLGIERMIFHDSIPPIDDETKRKLASAAREEYRKDLDNNEDITEIMEFTAEQNVSYYLQDILPVKGSYGISNTGSVNVYYIDENNAYAGINNQTPEWCEIIEIGENDNGDVRFGFELMGVTVPVDEIMKV